MQGEQDCKKTPHRIRNIMVFGAVALIWFLADFFTKRYFDSTFKPGQVIAGPFLGLFRFELVHNTGAAWGMFDTATDVLGIVSLVICALIAIYALVVASRTSLRKTIALALVLAGGLGNAVSRFYPGYVVDFIDFTFMQFPVFNIADIGITCGIVLFILLVLLSLRHKDKPLAEHAHEVRGIGETVGTPSQGDGDGRSRDAADDRGA